MRPFFVIHAAQSTLIALLALSPSASARPEQSPALPDSIIDLRTADGVHALNAQWRYTDARIVETDHHAAGPDNKPSGPAVRTHDIQPRINSPEFDAAEWTTLDPTTLEARRTNGRLAFAWYRLDITVPDRIGQTPSAGATLVFEITADDYAEVWVNGALPQVLGSSGGPLVSGWNAPCRAVLTTDAKPGDHIAISVFAANGPLSDPPPNFVWIRSAVISLYKPGRAPFGAPVPVQTSITRLDPALDAVIAPGTRAERLADGFAFTEGPVWIPAANDNRYGGGGPGGYLLFSDPNKNVIHRWDQRSGAVSIFRAQSGYTGVGGPDIGEYHQPGSNGLALDPQGRLTICEHGNRRVTRLEPNGTITILADRFEGKRLNSPNDLVYRSDGALYFTDPPFGLPKVFDDPRKELPSSGVFCLYQGVLKRVSTDLAAPNGLAFSPDEKYLYVDNWEESRKVVMRYEVGPDGSLTAGTVFFDMTSTPGEIALDGLKVTQHGDLIVSGPGGLWVISASGKHLGTIAIPELAANFAFGDADRRTLYLCARTGLYRLRLEAGIARAAVSAAER